MAKIEFSELNLSRTLIKTKEKRNLKGKQNCIYLLCFSMQNDWFLPHILIILVYLQYWPLCKFEIRAVFKKIRNRLTAELPIVKLYRDDHSSWISNFFFTNKGVFQQCERSGILIVFFTSIIFDATYTIGCVIKTHCLGRLAILSLYDNSYF